MEKFNTIICISSQKVIAFHDPNTDELDPINYNRCNKVCLIGVCGVVLWIRVAKCSSGC